MPGLTIPVKVTLNEDAKTIFQLAKTRARTCLNQKCRYNMINLQVPDCDSLDCHLKVIEIGSDGRCMQFEPEEGAMEQCQK